MPGFSDICILAQVQLRAQHLPPKSHLGTETGVHDHAGQLDLRLVVWDQGDGDTGSDRDGGA